MASLDEDAMLVGLTEQIDSMLVEWMAEYKIPPLNLTAIILARLTWLAKNGQYTEDFIELLKAPTQVLEEQDKQNVVH
jgi:hypothetical protein